MDFTIKYKRTLISSSLRVINTIYKYTLPDIVCTNLQRVELRLRTHDVLLILVVLRAVSVELCLERLQSVLRVLLLHRAL